MTAPSPPAAEPVTLIGAAGRSDPAAVREAVAIAREWAGEKLVALLLAGSHAAGEAVWLEHGGRRVALSDVDLYAAMRDEAACGAAAARAAAGRVAASVRLRAVGLEAPLEVGFLTAAGLARMPAKPGTIELARHGRVVAGDAAAHARVPRWSPRDVPAEEAMLLLENRGLELLLAWPLLGSEDPLERARARHGTLKAAADLAAVLSLAGGELPDGTAARVTLARERLAGVPALAAAAGDDLRRLWSACVAWRSGGVSPSEPDAVKAEWLAAVRAWCAVWEWRFAALARDPWERALRSASRASLPRRLRRGLRAPGPGSFGRRLALAVAGTPQHRVNATAAVLLRIAASSPHDAELPAGARAALRRLGVSAAETWEAARRDVVRAWDEVVLGGRRGTGTA